MGNGKGVALGFLGGACCALGDSCGQPELPRGDADKSLEVAGKLALVREASAQGDLFFLMWLVGLHGGWFSLPALVPRQLLETFDRDYGVVLYRCPDCRCGVGNATILGECPICGGELEKQSLASDAHYWESEEEFQARISRGQRTLER
jgi:hypothetical protein